MSLLRLFTESGEWTLLTIMPHRFIRFRTKHEVSHFRTDLVVLSIGREFVSSLLNQLDRRSIENMRTLIRASRNERLAHTLIGFIVDDTRPLRFIVRPLLTLESSNARVTDHSS